MAQKKSAITISTSSGDESHDATKTTQRIGRRSTQAAPGDTRFLDARTMTPVKMEVPTICDRIRFYREKANMEQKELGSRIGVRGNAICNWENGRGRPDISLLPLICETLNVSLYDLFAIPMPIDKYTAEEQDIIENYRKLSDCHKHGLRGTLANLTEAQEAESRREVIELVYHDKQLAAGFDPGLEFDDTGEPIYLYAREGLSEEYSVFPVSGDSMEPDYHDGDMVLVEEYPGCGKIERGEIGAFIIGKETYIKVYEKDGLHSLNEDYKTMKFNEDDRVYLIGKIVGKVTDDDIVSDSDRKRYLRIRGK